MLLSRINLTFGGSDCSANGHGFASPLVPDPRSSRKSSCVDFSCFCQSIELLCTYRKASRARSDKIDLTCGCTVKGTIG